MRKRQLNNNKKSINYHTSNKYIILRDRGEGDRIGAQITWYICQIIYAHYHLYYIDVTHLLYENSIFMQSIRKFIELYNKDKIKGEYVDLIDNDLWYQLNAKVVVDIKLDLISYFRNNLFKIRDFLDEFALFKKYSIKYNSRETILIHLRLDDINFGNRIDYDGSFSLNYFANKINKNIFNYDDETQTYYNAGITKDTNLYNAQSPISDDKLNKVIDNIKARYPTYKVLIVTSPIGDVTLNYPIIRSPDPSIDLFYLCNCDFVILSRSTFALSSLYFGRAKEFWIPTWGYVASMGLETNYCKSSVNASLHGSTCKFNYFH